MIELPRAALIAGELAGVADFFSFGTNDLTQMTYGLSRDDAQARFLSQYLEQRILQGQPVPNPRPDRRRPADANGHLGRAAGE